MRPNWALSFEACSLVRSVESIAGQCTDKHVVAPSNRPRVSPQRSLIRPRRWSRFGRHGDTRIPTLSPYGALSADRPPPPKPPRGIEMNDRLKIICSSCGKALTVPSSAIGRKGKCPGCKHQMLIEAPPQAPPRVAAAPPKPPEAPVRAQLAEQPTHRDEFTRDRRRVVTAVSTAPDKYALVEPYLMDYEQPVAIAVQRQFPFSLFADIVVLSSHRLLIFKRFFSKIDMIDVNYVDFGDVRIRQGFFTSALTISTGDRRDYTVSYLVTDQALNLYRLCQDIETKARIARRQFQLEENRSRTSQMQINNLIAHPDPGQRPGSRIGQQDISRVGEEESNPFLLGE